MVTRRFCYFVQDDKQAKLDELRREIKRLKTESPSLSQIKALEEERARDRIAAVCWSGFLSHRVLQYIVTFKWHVAT